ncbi:hypothetical protein BDC45DRAFT_562809 [Circinella umbellata]|nr:hypothetical protein BDC45DRAFT_562809 [Circinella umbellata]
MSDTINNKIVRCTKVIPYNNYQKTIKEFHHVTGEEWIHQNKRYRKGWFSKDNIDKYDGLERKRRKIDHQYYDGEGRKVIFNETFLCAYSGKKRVHSQRVSSDKTRPRQEKSKKVDCPTKLEAKRYEEDPDNVTLRFFREHTTLHSLRDVKILIKERLEEGVDVPTIVDLVNDKQEKKKEKSLGYYKIMVRQTRMAEHDFSSVGLWLVELESKSYHTFLCGQSNADMQVYNFGFGFVAPTVQTIKNPQVKKLWILFGILKNYKENPQLFLLWDSYSQTWTLSNKRGMHYLRVEDMRSMQPDEKLGREELRIVNLENVRDY